MKIRFLKTNEWTTRLSYSTLAQKNSIVIDHQYNISMNSKTIENLKSDEYVIFVREDDEDIIRISTNKESLVIVITIEYFHFHYNYFVSDYEAFISVVTDGLKSGYSESEITEKLCTTKKLFDELEEL